MVAVRYAWRSLSRSRGFVLIAILALGLGLGLATTMFGVMDAVVNPYVPYRDADALFNVVWRIPRFVSLSQAELYRAVREHVTSFESVVPFAFERLPLEARGASREVNVGRVTADYFATIGVRPTLGRAFNDRDGATAAVVSLEVWRSLFGMRRTLAAATITLGDVTYDIVGVLPGGATHPYGATIWLPLQSDYEDHPFYLLTRLKPGARYAGASAEISELERLITAHLAADVKRLEGPVSLRLVAVRSRGEQLRDIHLAMVGAAVVVLLIACVNLAHLMLARGLSRRRELAVRLALGASRGAIVWQLFAECVAITVAGSALGALVAVWGANVLASVMPFDVSWIGLVKPHLGWRAFALGALAATGSAVVFGLIPAAGIALDVGLDEPLKDGAGTTGRHRQRYSPLVVFEVALALVLLMAGGLLLRTVRRLQAERFGFDTRDLSIARVFLPRCALDSTLRMCGAIQYRAFGVQTTRENIVVAVAGVRDVESAAFVGSRASVGGRLTAEMVGGDSTRVIHLRYYAVVSPAYLRTVRLPVLSGRDFELGDASGNGVAIIDPIAAARLYPHQNPVGRMLQLGAPGSDAPWVRIVGVARNPSVLERTDVPPEPAVWVARPLGVRGVSDGVIVVRTTPGRGARAAVELRRSLGALPAVRGVTLEPYSYRHDADVASHRFLARVFVAMGAVALALAALGLYGVLSYSVGQRLREFAVRVALGARSDQVVAMVLRDALVMLLAGIGIGAFVAMAATKYVDALLSGVYRTDVVSLLLSEIVLVGVGLAAALAPARRASRASPLDILRAV